MKRVLKKIFKSRSGQFVLGTLGGLYTRLIWLTARVEQQHIDNVAPLWQNQKPFIGLIWHGRLLMSRLGWGDRRTPYALISGSSDGRLLKHAANICGIHAIHGSSSQGGGAALRGLVRLARQNETLLIAPDGPRGPAQQMQLGALEVARLTGLPIVPFAASSKHGKKLRSWDRFMIPRLFDRIVIVWGKPVHVPREADLEKVRVDMDMHLTALQDRADEAVKSL